MKTILVPLDGSALAEQVWPYVQLLAPMLNAKIHLLRVISDTDEDNLFSESIAAVYGVSDPLATHEERERSSLELLRQQAEIYLLSQAQTLQRLGTDVEIDVRFGVPAEVIVAVAESKHADLIAMATHGYSGLRRWALGSVTDKVVHMGTAPMLIVRSAPTAPLDAPSLRRIMLPLDGSALARQAMPFAAALAACAHAELMPMTVVIPPISGNPSILPDYEEALRVLPDRLIEELGPAAEDLRHHDVPITPLAVSGFVADAIVEAAAQHKVDLIVMATHGAGGLRRWMLGSIADKVLHATTIPLVLVRAKEVSR